MSIIAEKTLKPTRKLSYASATAVVLFLLSLVIDVDPQVEQVVNIVVPLGLAYVVKNADTPGGVPTTSYPKY